MTKKRILNTTSRKKRDAMVTWSNTSATGVSATPAIQPLIIKGAGGLGTGGYQGFVLFNVTARSLVQFGGGAGVVGQEAMRTATTCYMRGLSEHVRLQSSSAVPWLWRRVCFTSRDLQFREYLKVDTPTTTNYTYIETSNGYKRAAINQVVNNSQDTQNNVMEILFRGSNGVDWTDPILAPVDTRRIDLKYDKTVRLFSGNQSGMMKEKKVWHPMNKNMVYDDDESGEVEISRVYSVTDKRGMGDYLILDLFSPGFGATATDYLAVQYSSTVYWHEK